MYFLLCMLLIGGNWAFNWPKTKCHLNSLGIKKAKIFLIILQFLIHSISSNKKQDINQGAENK